MIYQRNVRFLSLPKEKKLKLNGKNCAPNDFKLRKTKFLEI